MISTTIRLIETEPLKLFLWFPILPFLIIGLIALSTLNSSAQRHRDVLILSEEAPIRVKIIEYYRDSSLRKVSFATRVDTAMSKPDLFMRGYLPDTENSYFRIDSFVSYDRWDDDELYHIKSNSSTFTFPEGSISLNKKIRVEGKINSSKEIKIPVSNIFKNESHLRVYSYNSYLRYPASLLLQPREEQHMPVQVTFPHVDQTATLILENSQQDRAPILIEICGYDLKSADFSESLEDALKISLEDRKKLILLSDGREKLLRLTLDDTIVDYFKYSKIRNEINLKGFKKATYVLEAVDLTTNVVKYALVKVH